MSAALPAPEPWILIVDDDPLVLHALETTAVSAGHRVFATEDPLVGWQYLKDHPVSVVIADQRMDAMSGLELLGHARELQPHASRILITGLLSVKMLTEAVNCGEIYRFIAKPWSTPELLATMHNAVQRYHLLGENDALTNETRRVNEALRTEKRALEEQLATLAHDKAALEKTLAGFQSVRPQLFEFCDAVLSAFDNLLAVRTRHTVEICRQLAETAGLTAEVSENLIASAWFHDLGLIASSRPVASGASEIHEENGANFQDHPRTGERLARAAGLGEEVATAVRGHHESFEGSGFPDRLRGRQIPELARWLTPVVYYLGSGLSREAAIEEMERLSGIAFDPLVVPHFLRLALRLPSPNAILQGSSVVARPASRQTAQSMIVR